MQMMGKQFEQIILYGSVARGTNTEESDVDIALIIYGTIDDNLDDKLLDFIVDMNLKHNRVFSVVDINSTSTPAFCNFSFNGIKIVS